MSEVPAWRYHATQGAKIFLTEDEIAEAEAQGWADSPAAALEAVDIDGPAMPDDGVLAVLDASEAALADAEVVEARGSDY